MRSWLLVYRCIKEAAASFCVNLSPFLKVNYRSMSTVYAKVIIFRPSPNSVLVTPRVAARS